MWRSEESPVCRGEVWRSMFYWLEEEDVGGSECCNEGRPAFGSCAQDVICNYTLSRCLICLDAVARESLDCGVIPYIGV